MFLEELSEPEFAERLNGLVSPSEPVRTIQRLHGRGPQLKSVERALYANRRHVFIHGDRGVGKSSLAATAANQCQRSDARYLDVSCSPDATFTSMIASIASQALKGRTGTTSQKDTRETSWKWLKIVRTTDTTPNDLHQAIRGLTDAVEVLREVATLHSAKPVVVVDEFDRIASTDQRNLFADLLKHLGDKEVDVKFIFTGVGRSLEDLLGAHPSAIRQLETLELPRLSWEGRCEIVVEALNSFRVDIDRNLYLRIAAVSDGYPYYVHLLTEKLLWRLYDRKEVATKVLREDYENALGDAIASTSAELKRPYEAAVMDRSDDYEPVLWSTADSEYLHRFSRQMHSSYEYVLGQIGDGRAVLPYNKYSTRIRTLTRPGYGGILVHDSKRPGLYGYRENMLRGYVRMQAEAHGIRLAGYQKESEEPQRIHAPARASTGYRGPTTPREIHFGKGR